MGYLFLLASLIFSITKGYCSKRTSGLLTKKVDAVFISFVRMLFCVLIGLVFVIFQEGAGALRIDGTTLLISAFSGVATALFVASWLIAARTGSYMMIDVFLTMGVIIPLVLCNLLFREQIRPIQWFGILILIGSVYTMCSYNTSLKGRMSLGSFGLLVLCGAAYGLTDFSQKLFINYCPDGSIAVFNFYTYVVAALFLLIVLAFTSSKESMKKADMFGLLKKIWGFVMAMALCLFMNSYFKTRAAVYLPSAKLYPLNQGLALVLAMVMCSVCFKEKVTTRCLLGVGLCFVALIFINVL